MLQHQTLGVLIGTVKKLEQMRATPLDRVNRVYSISQQVADILRAEQMTESDVQILSGFLIQVAAEAIVTLQSITP